MHNILLKKKRKRSQEDMDRFRDILNGVIAHGEYPSERKLEIKDNNSKLSIAKSLIVDDIDKSFIHPSEYPSCGVDNRVQRIREVLQSTRGLAANPDNPPLRLYHQEHDTRTYYPNTRRNILNKIPPANHKFMNRGTDRLSKALAEISEDLPLVEGVRSARGMPIGIGKCGMRLARPDRNSKYDPLTLLNTNLAVVTPWIRNQFIKKSFQPLYQYTDRQVDPDIYMQYEPLPRCNSNINNSNISSKVVSRVNRKSQEEANRRFFLKPSPEPECNLPFIDVLTGATERNNNMGILQSEFEEEAVLPKNLNRRKAKIANYEKRADKRAKKLGDDNVDIRSFNKVDTKGRSNQLMDWITRKEVEVGLIEKLEEILVTNNYQDIKAHAALLAQILQIRFDRWELFKDSDKAERNRILNFYKGKTSKKLDCAQYSEYLIDRIETEIRDMLTSSQGIEHPDEGSDGGGGDSDGGDRFGGEDCDKVTRFGNNSNINSGRVQR